MSDLTDLYQEIILDHNRRPRNYRVLEHPTHSAEGFNPLCGDQLTVALKVADDRIVDIAFQGEGCAISKASASLMTVRLKGKTLEEAKREFGEVLTMLTGSEEESDEPPRHLGNVAALRGVRRFPVRVKCATLAWHALEAAIEGRESISTEG